MKKEMPPKNDIFGTLELKWTTPYDDILAKVDYIEQTDAGLEVHCNKVEKEKKMNKNEELKNVDTIIITRDENTVYAYAYDKCPNGDIRTTACHRAIAKCGPDDIFDFNIGAKLAFNRLYEGYDMTPKPKRKPYNGLIYINKYPGAALKDKSIYRIKDGVIQKCMFGAGPFIYEGMSDKELSIEIDEVVYGRFGFHNTPCTVAHFVDNDKT